MTDPIYNELKAEAFSERLITMLNEASLALMISIGHQTGLFDTLEALPAANSSRIAAEAGLNERYVREWLGAMVTGKIVEYDPDSQKYGLPAEHAAWLTRGTSNINIGANMPFIPVLAVVEQEIIDCFYEGGGVSYAAFPQLHYVLADSNRKAQDRTLIREVLPLVPDLIERLEAGIQVADIGCGQGHRLNLMAQAFPGSQFIGYDFVEDNIAASRHEAKQLELNNVQFELKDITTIAREAEFDLVTAFDVIHDQAKPAEVLGQVAAALKPDGIFFMMDIRASSHLHENADHFLGPFLYTVSCMHCMTVSLAQDGAGLGTMWGEQLARQLLAEAGFTRVEVKQRENDMLNNYYIAYKAR